jgi:hypothetical protein
MHGSQSVETTGRNANAKNGLGGDLDRPLCELGRLINRYNSTSSLINIEEVSVVFLF